MGRGFHEGVVGVVSGAGDVGEGEGRGREGVGGIATACGCGAEESEGVEGVDGVCPGGVGETMGWVREDCRVFILGVHGLS